MGVFLFVCGWVVWLCFWFVFVFLFVCSFVWGGLLGFFVFFSTEFTPRNNLLPKLNVCLQELHFTPPQTAMKCKQTPHSWLRSTLTPTGVRCWSIHPEHPSSVGCYSSIFKALMRFRSKKTKSLMLLFRRVWWKMASVWKITEEMEICVFTLVSKILIIWKDLTRKKESQGCCSVFALFCEQMRKANLKRFSQDRKVIGLAGNQARYFKVITKLTFHHKVFPFCLRGKS